MEKAKQAFEGLSVSMRFILPIMMSMFIYNYSSDQNRIKESLDYLKKGQETAWIKMDAISTKANDNYVYVLQHCCSGKVDNYGTRN